MKQIYIRLSLFILTTQNTLQHQPHSAIESYSAFFPCMQHCISHTNTSTCNVGIISAFPSVDNPLNLLSLSCHINVDRCINKNYLQCFAFAKICKLHVDREAKVNDYMSIMKNFYEASCAINCLMLPKNATEVK